MVQIVSEKTTQVGYLAIKEVTFTAEDLNQQIDWTYVRNGQFVVGLVYNKTRKTFLFVRQYRIALSENKEPPLLIEAVAGIHDKPTAIETLKKEIEEELGMGESIVTVEYIGRFYSTPGVTCEFGYHFYVEIENENPPVQFGGVEAEGEYIERIELSTNEMLRIVKFGQMKVAFEMSKFDQVIDSKTMQLINWWIANKADFETIQWYRAL